MRKRRLHFCFAVIAMLIAGCGEKTAVLPLELPDAEQITAVEVTGTDGFSAHARIENG